ncbi:hypothetical protein [Agrobacterium tumefaciens]|uniref:Uncharacterized protein n=1 Tax=Agrobacterium tumefaciens TaxID=358 RepID=A0A2L2LHA5_AGRTU|nr:hypothetical protein [Agrobacterium tumefaciens]AVH43656.1 hypothetical protein At1D1609_36030 [Agrobacterium tumefaciens]NSY97600.1 type II toxin-antitoxin system VapC family toxin [Agrobacterium tumefaciens]
MKYLATTCLVSEVAKPRPKPHVLEFIATNTFVLSPETLIDIQRGILRTSRTNPHKAAELREWLSSVSGRWPLVSGREQEKAKLVAAMLECRELKNIWLPQPKAAHPGFGYHVSIAAAAITHELPLAGFGIDTFLQIDRYFSLPGIFDLKDESWRSATIECRAVDWKHVRTQLRQSLDGRQTPERRAA